MDLVKAKFIWWIWAKLGTSGECTTDLGSWRDHGLVQQYRLPAAILPHQHVGLALFDDEAFANQLSVNFLNERPCGVQVRRYESGLSLRKAEHTVPKESSFSAHRISE